VCFMDRTSSVTTRCLSYLYFAALLISIVTALNVSSAVAQSMTLQGETIVSDLPSPDAHTSPGATAVSVPLTDSIWVVNYRKIVYGPAPDPDDARIKYSEIVDGCSRSASWEELHAAMSDCCPTVMFVHGNNTSPSVAIKEGRALFRILKKSAHGQPLRMIIWSWPSEKTGNRLRRDLEIKEKRADIQAAYVARWLEFVSPDTPLSLVGYSFGARAVNGAMQRLENMPNMKRGAPVRVAFIAAALNFRSLFSAQPDMPLHSRLDRILVTRNTNDSALRWFPFLAGAGRRALGQVGPGTLARDVSTIEVSRSVGRTHDFLNYLSSCTLRQRLSSLAFPDRSHTVISDIAVPRPVDGITEPADDSTRIGTQDAPALK